MNATSDGALLSSIDVYCANCDIEKLKIEYKYGSSSITSVKIKKQFIESDLFNTTALDQIQWQLKDTGFNKDLLIQYLNQHRTAIESLGVDKINSLLGVSLPPNTSANILSNSLIDYLSNTNNFNRIFKF